MPELTPEHASCAEPTTLEIAMLQNYSNKSSSSKPSDSTHPCTHAHRRAYTRAHTTHAGRTPACTRTVARDNNRQADGHTWPQPPGVVGVIRSLPVGTHGLVQQFLVSLQALRGGASDNGRDRAPLGRHDLRQVQQLLVLLARPLCSGRPTVVSTPLRCSRRARAGRAHAAHIQGSTRALANLSF